MNTISWPKEFPGLEQIDQLLRCGICYEYLNTALMTACSHNYCSICIRKSITFRSQCPICMKETYESHLRNNRILDDIIAVYLGFKNKLISTLLSIAPDTEKAREKHPTQEFGNNSPANNKSLTTSTVKKANTDKPNVRDLFSKELISNPHIKIVSDNELHEITVPKKYELPSVSTGLSTASSSKPEQKIPAMFSPKKTAATSVLKRVSCPVCSVEIPEKSINFHLDSCLKRADGENSSRSCTSQSRRHLTRPVYHLLKPIELKKKLKEHGLSVSGNRDALIKRHQRFVLLYNAECDSLRPRSVTDIVKQIEQEEQEEKKTVVPVKSVFKTIGNGAVSEEVTKEYLRQNKSSFDALIENIKKRKLAKPSSESEEIINLDDFKDETTTINEDDNDTDSSDVIIKGKIPDTPEKKCAKRLSYSDEESDTNPPSFLRRASILPSFSTVENCEIDKCTLSPEAACSSYVARTPNSNQNSEKPDCLNSSRTPDMSLSPVFKSRSSVGKYKNFDVSASPEMFQDLSPEQKGLKAEYESDASSEASVSLLTYNEVNTEDNFLPEESPKEVIEFPNETTFDKPHSKEVSTSLRHSLEVSPVLFPSEENFQVKDNFLPEESPKEVIEFPNETTFDKPHSKEVSTNLRHSLEVSTVLFPSEEHFQVKGSKRKKKLNIFEQPTDRVLRKRSKQ